MPAEEEEKEVGISYLLYLTILDSENPLRVCLYYFMVHHKRSLSLIPRSQCWACGPSAFIYQRIILLDYFSRKFYDYVFVFLR